MTTCEYFTRYGDSGRRGVCVAAATLALKGGDDSGAGRITPPIRVCEEHADAIVMRFPTLGDVERRFESIADQR